VSKGGRERALEEYSDADASWGHRSAVSTRKGGGYYGYQVHLAACFRTGLPLAWEVATGRTKESTLAVPLIDKAARWLVRGRDVRDEQGLRHRSPVRRLRGQAGSPDHAAAPHPGVKAGADEPPSCEHGRWQFAGAVYMQEASMWRCPTGECKPASRWIKASRIHPLVREIRTAGASSTRAAPQSNANSAG
jgi:hypothetical protein